MQTRRFFLLAATASLALPRRLWAGTTLTLGSRQIDTLSDGFLQMSADGPQIPCNVTLLRDGERVVLFDVGSGHDFQSTAGRLLEALEALGVAPDQVTDVVFTHAHPDHLWGLLDEFDEPLFAHAKHQIGRIEHDYWMDPATATTIAEDRQFMVAGAQRRLAAVEVMLFEDGEEVVPGVVARLTPGHTPGHMAFVIDGQAVVLGDCIGSTASVENPAAPAAMDQDQPLGATTRAALVPELAASGQTVIGFHLPGGGVGRILADGAAFRFEEV